MVNILRSTWMWLLSNLALPRVMEVDRWYLVGDTLETSDCPCKPTVQRMFGEYVIGHKKDPKVCAYFTRDFWKEFE